MSNDNNGWKEVGGQSQLDMWDEVAEKSIEGIYTEKRSHIGKNNSNIYVIKLSDGNSKGVWGSTVLDGRFENIPVGSEVRIVFNGKVSGKDARGAYKSYSVFMKEATTPAPSTSKAVGTDSDVPF